MASENAETANLDPEENCNQALLNYVINRAGLNENGVTHVDVHNEDEAGQSVSIYNRLRPIYVNYNIIERVENLTVEAANAPTTSTQTPTNEDETPTTSNQEQQTPIYTSDVQSTHTPPSTEIIDNQDEFTRTSVQPNRSVFKRILTLRKGKTYGLKSKLKQSYKVATLPCIPWLNKGRDLVMSEYYTELQLDTSDTIIPVEKLFVNIKKKNPRILIEGQPGYGKTTLATKLVYDWALSKSYIKHFKLVFLLPLRELRQRNVAKVTRDIAECCDYNNIAKVNDIVQENLPKTLFIFDGLDELSKSDRLPILKILYGHEFSDATVIVTCRTALFTLEHNELDLLSGGLSKKKEFYDRRVNVLGIRIADRESFLLKFVSSDITRLIIRNINQLSESAAIMFGSPLFLILLAFMASKTNDLTSLRTKTQFFKRLFNYLVNHSMKKPPNPADEDEIDLFQIDSEINDTQKTVQKFGELSLSHIRTNKLQFEHNRLTTRVYKMGFLINHKEISTFDSRFNYEAFHLTILEFAVAYSIWMDFKQKGTKNSFNFILPLYLKLGETSLIFSFLVGLLQDDADKLFQHLSPHAQIFSMADYTLWNLLTEYEESSCSDRLLPILVDFISPHIDHDQKTLYNFYSSNFYSEILKIGIRAGRVKLIFINTKFLPNLPRNIAIPSLHVRIDANLNYSLIDWLCEIKCEKMIIDFRSTSVVNRTIGSHLLDSLPNLSTLPSKSLEIFFPLELQYPTNPNPFLDCITTIPFTKFVTHSDHDYETTFLNDLLQRNQLETLRLHPSKDNFEKISDYFRNCTKLTSLYIHCITRIQIDLHTLTNGGEKQYNSLLLEMNEITCKKPLINKNCIQCLILDDVIGEKMSSEVLNMINPSVLKCNAITFAQLPSSWTGYLRLTEFSVIFVNSVDQAQFWNNLSRCRNIITLELIFPYDSIDPELLATDEADSCLQQLRIETLIIHDDSFTDEATKRLVEIFSSLRGLVKDYPYRFVISLSYFDERRGRNLCSIVETLLQCLTQNRLNSVCLICYDYRLWDYLIEKQIVDCSVFIVKHFMYGSLNCDPVYRQILYDADPFSDFYKATVCLEIKIN